ncbi:MAG: hypothetical protein AAFY83_11705, partial [Pseudomonadota bacterium]
KAMRARSVPVIVYSGQSDVEWPATADHYTEDPDCLEAFLRAASGKKTLVVLDEAQILFGLISAKSHPTIHNLTGNGRHAGFSVQIISNYPTKLPPFVRSNLHALNVFTLQNEDQSKAIVSDRGISKKWAEVIRKLKPLHYLEIRPQKEPVIKRLR